MSISVPETTVEYNSRLAANRERSRVYSGVTVKLS